MFVSFFFARDMHTKNTPHDWLKKTHHIQLFFVAVPLKKLKQWIKKIQDIKKSIAAGSQKKTWSDSMLLHFGS